MRNGYLTPAILGAHVGKAFEKFMVGRNFWLEKCGATINKYPPPPPCCPPFPPFSLMLNGGKLGTARPPLRSLNKNFIFGGAWPKNFPFFHQKPKKFPIFIHFPVLQRHRHQLNEIPATANNFRPEQCAG